MASTIPGLFRTLLDLGRVSNLPTVWTNVLLGWFVSGGPWSVELGFLIIAVSFLYIGGMMMNDVVDAEWDREHAPDRPIPSGRIRKQDVEKTVLGLVVAGGFVAHSVAGASLYLCIALTLAIGLYNWLHKRWAGSVLIMGACRALVILLAASAAPLQEVRFAPSTTIVLLACASLLYIAGLTLFARYEHLSRDEAQHGAKWKLRLGGLLLTLPVLYPLFTSRSLPGDALTYASIGIAVIAIWAWISKVRRTFREAIPQGVSLALAGICLYDAAALFFVDRLASGLALGCFGLTLLLQKKISAT